MAKKRPTKISLTRVRDEAVGCRACDPYKHATQNVFGEGPSRAGLRRALATVHPSSIRRAPDDQARRREMKQFMDDLRTAVRALSST